MKPGESSLMGFLEAGNLEVHPQLWSMEPESAGVIRHHGTWVHAEVRWPEELVVAIPGHQSPGGLDLAVGSLGTWKPLADFCHFFASPSCENY